MARVAIVTGAAQGIGRAVALTRIEWGRRALADIPSKQDALEQVVKEIERLGRKAIAVTGDGRMNLKFKLLFRRLWRREQQRSLCSIKIGVRAITQTAALEWGQHNITVNAYAPGIAHTEMFTSTGGTVENLDKIIPGNAPIKRVERQQRRLERSKSALATTHLVFIARANYRVVFPPTSNQRPHFPDRLNMTKVAIVTGAAQGIGRAIALRLASDGMDVAIIDLPAKKESLEKVSGEIQALGRKSLSLIADVSKEQEVKDAVKHTVEILGGLDVMVANAGIYQAASMFDVSDELLDKVLGTNLKGVLYSYRAAALQMIQQGRGGRIIGASSTAANVPYAVSKFGVRAITQTAALEWGQYGITVNAYAPGIILTPLVTESGGGPNGENYVDMLMGNAAMKRVGQPEEVAALVGFLASDGASYITVLANAYVDLGLGRAIALRLASDGVDIAVNDITKRQTEVEQLIEEIKSLGRNAIAVLADVSKEAEVQDMVSKTVKELGGLDIMVANAGVHANASILDVTDEIFDWTMNVNCKGVLYCYRAAATQMINQGRGGRIIGASSVRGLNAGNLDVAYATSKFAVRAITQTAALEWGEYNITVNAYAPGLINTPMVKAAGNGASEEQTIQLLLPSTHVKRLGKVEEVAALSEDIPANGRYLTRTNNERKWRCHIKLKDNDKRKGTVQTAARIQGR
ncbi:short chain dehydrogenase [Rhizoctonia solani]|uniref:Short chain dehydrogenase n=1 Tax=Rhizoctonia solani TaxID=456999 RepID=A0A8H8P3L2_9AGAM|nr:short chain dehydrogenase [Rhizoctonia solani]QRW24033.1 short chain dehydrogenase [Rhizoctonia solani]